MGFFVFKVGNLDGYRYKVERTSDVLEIEGPNVPPPPPRYYLLISNMFSR